MDGEMKQKRRKKNKLEKSKLRKKTTLRKAFIGEQKYMMMVRKKSKACYFVLERKK